MNRVCTRVSRRDAIHRVQGSVVETRFIASLVNNVKIVIYK